MSRHSTRLDPATDNRPSLLEGRYVLDECIGQGGFATVRLATDTLLNRSVAVKLLHPAMSREPDFVEQFLAMERRVARLLHPNLVTIYDAGLVDTTCYVVMEYVSGGSLRDLLQRREQPPLPFVVSIMRQVASALELLHQERIVHGDVKPDNVLLDEYGEAKLVDFGIARIATTTSRVIRSEDVGGSAPYLAPEQLLAGQYDARSDIYALGLVVFELLAGRRAFEGENWVAVAAARLARDPQPIDEVRPGLPPRLVEVVMRCLEREPARRFESASALCQALAELETAVAQAPAESAPGPLAVAESSAERPAAVAAAPAQHVTAAPVTSRHSVSDGPTARPVANILRGEHQLALPLLALTTFADLALLLVILVLARP